MILDCNAMYLKILRLLFQNNSLLLLQYGDDLYEEFTNIWFSFTGSPRKDLKPWHWKNCKISFEKNSSNTIKFMVKRTKNIFLEDNTKLRWDKRQSNTSLKLNRYTLHYVIDFDVKVPLLPNMVYDEKIEEQVYGKKEMEIRGTVGFCILTLNIKYGYGKMLIMKLKIL